MDDSSKWTKTLNILGLLGMLLGVAYINPIAQISTAHEFYKSIARSFVNTDPEVLQESLGAQYRRGCPAHQFASVKLVSASPIMMLIDGFVTPAEAEVMLRVAYSSHVMWLIQGTLI